MDLMNTIAYQIYPLGFCGAPPVYDGQPQARIRKVMEWAEYIRSLGATAVLFNPVFDSESHGYDTKNFGVIDPRLGTNEDFAAVCACLHEHGLQVILDGVFNHVGRGFWAFQDVLKNRENSPYRDWFLIRFDQDNGYHDGFSYECWEGHSELARLNLRNPEVVRHLLWNVGVWMDEFRIDGLRLDVAYCLEPDFLRQLRNFCVERNRDFRLIGEILFGDYRRIVNPSMTDSATNYECYKGLYSSLNDGNLCEIAWSLNRQFGSDGIYRQLPMMSFVDNHDVSRIASQLRDARFLPLIYTLLYAMPGFPCLYYGSEWGASGRKEDGDARLRPCFARPEENALTDHLRLLARIRRETSALRIGDYRPVHVANRQLIFLRVDSAERLMLTVNLDDQPCRVALPGWRSMGEDLISGASVSIQGEIALPPCQAQIIRLAN